MGEIIPEFPWPPPQASASIEIDHDLLSTAGQTTSLQSAARKLSRAFDDAGYGEKSYYAVPDGFIMVSRLEQIKADGLPAGDDRWSLDVRPYTRFTVAAYLRALFTAQEGHYRVICFVVSPHPFSQGEQKVTDKQALAWLPAGMNDLPAKIGILDYSQDYHCTAFVYEFEKSPGDTPMLALPPKSLGVEAHMKGCGIIQALEARRGQ